jgi:hypothetical protein
MYLKLNQQIIIILIIIIIFIIISILVQIAHSFPTTQIYNLFLASNKISQKIQTRLKTFLCRWVIYFP